MFATVLVIAYHFPPENVIGAARPARFVDFLPEFGWHCSILTAARQNSDSNSRSVRWVEDRTRDYWDGVSGAAAPPALQRYLELAARKFMFPGAVGLGWSLAATRSVPLGSHQGDPQPRAVLSTFPPLAAHLAGWRIARKLQLPWIADFRDPFANPVPARSGGLRRALPRILESWFFRDAAAIILNTEAMAALYRERYPQHAAKLNVIWNGFNPSAAISALPIPERNRRVLSHVGSLYAGRNPTLLLEALQRLRQNGHPLANTTEILLAGPAFASSQEQEAMQRAASQGWLSLRPEKIPQAEAIQLSQEADGLLLLQPQSSIQVPGKLFEYVQIGRPILSLSPKGSAIEWILQRCGIPYVNVCPDDGVERAAEKVAGYLALSTEPRAPSAWFQENFNAHAQAGQLAAVLGSVTSGR